MSLHIHIVPPHYVRYAGVRRHVGLSTFVHALIGPTPVTYDQIADSAPPTKWIAFWWMLFASLFGVCTALLSGALTPAAALFEGEAWGTALKIGLIVAAATVAVMAVYIAYLLILHNTAHGLGSTAEFHVYVYTVSAAVAPLLVIASLILAGSVSLPALGLLLIPLALYAVWLLILATREAYSLSWLRAAGTLVIGTAISILISAVLAWSMTNRL